MNKGFHLVFERAIRCHMHDTDLNRTISFGWTQSCGLKIKDRKSVAKVHGNHYCASQVRTFGDSPDGEGCPVCVLACSCKTRELES